jgi:hypothetical protein
MVGRSAETMYKHNRGAVVPVLDKMHPPASPVPIVPAILPGISVKRFGGNFKVDFIAHEYL